MDEELEKNKNSNQEEGKRYKHISEKKKVTFSAKKFSRFLFFIIVLAAVIFATNRVTQSFIDKKKSLLNDMFDQSNKDTIMEENNPYGLYEDYDEYKDEKQKDYII